MALLEEDGEVLAWWGTPVEIASALARREREGLLKPSRSEGNTRLYTSDDIERLEVILHLTRDLGVNLAGVEIILNMREKMGEMQSQIQQFIATLNSELAARTAPAPASRSNSLIPVINAKPRR